MRLADAGVVCLALVATCPNFAAPHVADSCPGAVGRPGPDAAAERSRSARRPAAGQRAAARGDHSLQPLRGAGCGPAPERLRADRAWDNPGRRPGGGDGGGGARDAARDARDRSRRARAPHGLAIKPEGACKGDRASRCPRRTGAGASTSRGWPSGCGMPLCTTSRAGSGPGPRVGRARADDRRRARPGAARPRRPPVPPARRCAAARCCSSRGRPGEAAGTTCPCGRRCAPSCIPTGSRSSPSPSTPTRGGRPAVSSRRPRRTIPSLIDRRTSSTSCSASSTCRTASGSTSRA